MSATNRVTTEAQRVHRGGTEKSGRMQMPTAISAVSTAVSRGRGPEGQDRSTCCRQNTRVAMGPFPSRDMNALNIYLSKKATVEVSFV